MNRNLFIENVNYFNIKFKNVLYIFIFLIKLWKALKKL